MGKDFKHNKKRIVSLFPFERGWKNVDLLKETGLIPYLLYKKYGYEAVLVGAYNQEECPALDQYINGVKLEYLPDGSIQSRMRYIRNYATEIDCLLLMGAYPINYQIAPLYKQLNPNGKICIELDANIGWMDRTIWDNDDFRAFMDACDVIMTAGYSIQKYLNKKWPWKVENILNGFYNVTGQNIEYKFEEKENIILTVSRLGTEQKAVHILLEAFAQISNQIPQWKLHLVGSMEVEFHEYIQKFYQRFPQLKERVIFIGEFHNKEELYEEYKKAKIFALSSVHEGFPNVIAEALNFGCVIATTKFDVYEECIQVRQCGMAADINDIQGFSEILLQLCQDSRLEEKSKNAYHYGRTHYNMEYIVEKLHYLIFEGDR